MVREFNCKELFRHCTTASRDDIGNERRCRYFGENHDLTLELVLTEYVLLERPGKVQLLCWKWRRKVVMQSEVLAEFWCAVVVAGGAEGAETSAISGSHKKLTGNRWDFVNSNPICAESFNKHPSIPGVI
ncbi:hypothetical protein B0H13DRAFT_1918350 [Mycena leptocephala]|nr:hypothetical protein B0H13DRAFT_1918350 [Mycena leptocephala]